MLKLFVPGPVEKFFLHIARQTPTEWNWLAFSAGIVVFCLFVTFILREVFLRIDAELALQARLKGHQPSAFIFALGHFAVWLPRVFGLVVIMVIGAEVLLVLNRLGAEIPLDVISAIRGLADRGWR